ncbi:hypothetical protein FHS70_005671 [Flammeovirga yaeyamensis]|nr:hypothetical protein [Flammeovirga yaeyamensis]
MILIIFEPDLSKRYLCIVHKDIDINPIVFFLVKNKLLAYVFNKMK